eukprot:COSAG01_NODE_47654_length_388_cov_0.892734_1_plen_65_part_00
MVWALRRKIEDLSPAAYANHDDTPDLYNLVWNDAGEVPFMELRTDVPKDQTSGSITENTIGSHA